MTRESTIAPLPELTQQIVDLGKLAEQLRENLRRTCQTLPQGTIDGLNHLTTGLDRLNQQVEQHEEERTNLQALADIGQVVKFDFGSERSAACGHGYDRSPDQG